ncbi:hypothetical protein CDAR_311791, partial [Caerostris darwini]
IENSVGCPFVKAVKTVHYASSTSQEENMWEVLKTPIRGDPWSKGRF